MTLLQAPTGTLLFDYKDIKQKFVHTLLLEEYGVSKKWMIIIRVCTDVDHIGSTFGGTVDIDICSTFAGLFN